jgi:tetratricopeptide (TPR) repeat protein
LWYAALLQGNYARALQEARALADLHSMLAMNPRQERPPILWLVYERFGKWQAILGEPAPPRNSVYLNGMWHYFRGSALAGAGELGKAEGELAALGATSRDPALKDVLSGANSAAAILAMVNSALSGKIATVRGRSADAVSAFEQAVQMQDALKFNEPPDRQQSMRLYLGAALLKAGRPKDAEAVYREEPRNLQENGSALFGLCQSVQAQGRTTETREIRKRI